MLKAIREAVARKKPVDSVDEGRLRKQDDANKVVAFFATPEGQKYGEWIEVRLAKAMTEAFESLGSANREGVLLKVAEAAAYYNILLDVNRSLAVFKT
jgi:hypothetical protein